MDKITPIITFITSQDWSAWLAAIITALTGVIAVAALIPGPEPERTLQKVVDFLSKFSRK